MNGIIVIDGPDGVGKSTLADRIAEKHGNAVVMHQGYTAEVKDDIPGYHTRQVLKALDFVAQGRLVIMDRLWMSELIYASVYRGGSKWPHYGRMMDRVLMKHAALYIVACDDDIQAVESRHKQMNEEREELFDSKMDEIAKRYLGMLHGDLGKVPDDYVEYYGAVNDGMTVRNDVLHYSIAMHGQNMDQFIDVALSRLRDRIATQYAPALDPANQNVLGHFLSAKYLMVGDVCNPKEKFPDLRWPFYDYGHSSLFLTQSMHTAWMDETQFMWTNANHDGDQHILQLKRSKPNLRVIALGREAFDKLTSLGIRDHVEVRHPSFALRFGPKETYPDELIAALGTGRIESR